MSIYCIGQSVWVAVLEATVSVVVCRGCGRQFTPSAPHSIDSLADLPGPAQPPQAAGWLEGATPFDAQLGTDSGPVEYDDPALLCGTCRAQTRADA